MTTGIATVTETGTGTGIVIEIPGAATQEMIEEMIDVMTEGTCAMIGEEMIVDVHVPATGETANPHPRLPEIPPRSPSQLPQSRTKSSRQREQD